MFDDQIDDYCQNKGKISISERNILKSVSKYLAVGTFFSSL